MEVLTFCCRLSAAPADTTVDQQPQPEEMLTSYALALVLPCLPASPLKLATRAVAVARAAELLRVTYGDRASAFSALQMWRF